MRPMRRTVPGGDRAHDRHGPIARGRSAGLASADPAADVDHGVVEIPLAHLAEPVPAPPSHRRRGLEELSASIREHGVLQPVLVTETLDGYQLVAGSAACGPRAGQAWSASRARRQLADRGQLEVALVENVQRADLDPIDEARLPPAHREFGLTRSMSPSASARRATIANTLRLLDLHADDPGRDRGRPRLTRARRGAGRVRVDGQPRPRTVIDQGLSVRQAEELVRRLREPRQPSEAPPAARRLDPDLERVEEDLRRRLGTKVSLSRSRKGGRIVIEYYSDEELGRLYERLIGGTA
jgi:ParB family chromosome partitioning protein